MRSRSCLLRNCTTISSPNVNDTPRSFSPHPIISRSGSDHSRSQSRPEQRRARRKGNRGHSIGEACHGYLAINCSYFIHCTHQKLSHIHDVYVVHSVKSVEAKNAKNPKRPKETSSHGVIAKLQRNVVIASRTNIWAFINFQPNSTWLE